MEEQLTQIVELLLTNPLLTGAEVKAACQEAKRAGYFGVAVPSSRLTEAYEFIDDSNLKVTCLIGFPDGLADSDVKRFETELAVDVGTHEIEVAMNLSRVKEGDYRYVLRELRDVAEAADERLVKVFLRPSFLTSREVEEACKTVLDSGCQFISTPETVSVPTIRRLVGENFAIMVSGVSSLAEASELVSAGVSRIGLVHERGFVR